MNRVNLSLILIICSMLSVPCPCWAENKDKQREDRESAVDIWYREKIAEYCEKSIEQGDFQEAINVCKKAISLDPDDPDAHLYLGRAYGELGMDKEAIIALKKAISLDPLGLPYNKLGKYKEYFEALDGVHPNNADAHLKLQPSLHKFLLGIYYSILGKDKDAINAYKQAIRLKPDYAYSHYNLGYLYGKLGMHKESYEALKQAIRLKPDHAYSHCYLGRAYYGLGKRRKAVEAYKQAIRIDPNIEQAYLGLGRAYFFLGMEQEEVNAYKQAIRINPDYANAHYFLGLHYSGIFSGIKDTGSAFEQYKILKRLDPELANKLFNVIYP